MFNQFVWFFVLVIFCQFFQDGRTTCTFDVRNLKRNTPVIVKNGNLVYPTGVKIKWNDNEKLSASCTGDNNGMINLNTPEITLECARGKVHLADNHYRKYQANLECHYYSAADVYETREKCSSGGTLKYIGFRLKKDNRFVRLFEVCYNMDSASVIYTHHKIPGNVIKFRQRKAEKPYFNPLGTPRKAQTMNAYGARRVTSQLNKLLGKAASKYISENCFISRGHLTPDADGYYTNFQLATYFYINAAPQWSIVNGENWERIENLVRRKAMNLKDNLEVYSGISGILRLPNEKNKQTSIYLAGTQTDKLIRMPKWFWKIIKYKTTGIAFVTLNNPFADKVEKVCENICDNHNWNEPEFNDFKKGYTLCCKISDVIAKFTEVPPAAAGTTEVMSF